MFCAKCGTENRIEQKYCRRCGHQLTGHRVALEGNYDIATTDIKKGEDAIGTGLIILGICALNITINWLLGGNTVGILINLAIGVIVALPFIIIGLKRIDHANMLLNPKDKPATQASEESKPDLIDSPAVAITDRSLSEAPASVTEHTTLGLKEPAQTQKQRSNKA
jgi:zinc-ribbon domain